MRNPFTSVSNLSFLRNNSKVSQQTKEAFRPRSLSNHRYLPQAQPSYMLHVYNQDYEYQARKRQESEYCRVMGLQAMRFHPVSPPKFDSEYYAMEEHPLQAQDKCQTDTGTISIQAAMRNTTDMFGSDYFSKRMQESQSEEPPLKKSIRWKDTGNNRERDRSSGMKLKKEVEVHYQKDSQEESCGGEYKQEEDPKTVYLKCKKMVFYLYEQTQ